MILCCLIIAKINVSIEKKQVNKKYSRLFYVKRIIFTNFNISWQNLNENHYANSNL